MLKFSKNVRTFVVRYFHTIRAYKKQPLRRRLHKFAHEKLLGKYLFLTNTVSSGVLMAAGDGMQQHMEFYKNVHKGDSYDWKRTINMTVIGLSLGPVQHYFYKYIDIFLPKRNLETVIKKILLDVTIASPITVTVFFYGLGFLEDGNLEKAHKEMEQKFLTIYMMDWMIWPPTQYLNFSYLPAKYRVVYTNFITMFHDAFLSYVKYNNEDFHYSTLFKQLRWRPVLVAENNVL